MPSVVNASDFHGTDISPDCKVYSPSRRDSITIASFGEALNPLCYTSIFHPFALAIINTTSSERILVRDHLGLRPLCYRYQSGQLIFGDTIPDIIRRLPQAPALLDSEVTHLFGDVHHYTDNTLHAGIKRFEPNALNPDT